MAHASRQQQARELWRSVVAMLRQGAHDDAERACRRAILTYPRDPRWKLALAWSLMGASRYDEALDLARQVAVDAPDNAQVFRTTALIHLRREDPDRALEAALLAYELSPDRASRDLLDKIKTGTRGIASRGTRHVSYAEDSRAQDLSAEWDANRLVSAATRQIKVRPPASEDPFAPVEMDASVSLPAATVDSQKTRLVNRDLSGPELEKKTPSSGGQSPPARKITAKDTLAVAPSDASETELRSVEGWLVPQPTRTGVHGAVHRSDPDLNQQIDALFGSSVFATAARADGNWAETASFRARGQRRRGRRLVLLALGLAVALGAAGVIHEGLNRRARRQQDKMVEDLRLLLKGGQLEQLDPMLQILERQDLSSGRRHLLARAEATLFRLLDGDPKRRARSVALLASDDGGPPSYDVVVARGMLASDAGRLALLDDLIALDSASNKDPSAAYLRARALLHAGQRHAALAMLEHMAELEPTHLPFLSFRVEQAVLEGHGRRAARLTDAMIDESPRSPWSRLALGMQHRETEIASLPEGQERWPPLPRVAQLRLDGVLAMSRSDPRSRSRDLLRLMGRARDLPELVVDLIDRAIARGDGAAAQDMLEQLDPGHPQHRRLSALLLSEQGRCAKAQSVLAGLLRAGSRDPGVALALLACQRRLDVEPAADLAPLLQGVYDRWPGDVGLKIERAWVEAWHDRLGLAAARLRPALGQIRKLDDRARRGLAYSVLARQAGEAGHRSEARRWAQRALREDPQRTEVEPVLVVPPTLRRRHRR